jgi:hypothetical protein
VRRRQLKRLWARLKQLSTMQLTREELPMKLGAARDQSRMAWRLAVIEIAADAATFSYRPRSRQAAASPLARGSISAAHQPRRGRPGQAVEPLSAAGCSRGSVQEPQEPAPAKAGATSRSGRSFTSSRVASRRTSSLPFWPIAWVFDQNAKLQRTLGKAPDASTETAGAFSPNAVVDIAFEYGLAGGRLFATDNASGGGRIVTVDPTTGNVVTLITGLPAGPTGQLAFQDGWIYWGAGATTNSGVVSKSDGGPFG